MFRKLIYVVFIIVFINPYYAFSDNTDDKINALLGKMSLQEKVGQMNQIALHILLDSSSKPGAPVLNNAKLREAVVKYGVGSILNAPDAISINEWHKLLTRIQNEVQKTSNKIPVIYGIDSIHGATYVKGADLFPHNIGLAATRDTTLAYQAAEVTAQETLAAGLKWNFDPVFDVAREPLWPRFEETFGEDTLLVTQMGLAMLESYKQQGIASTMKHFVGYSVPDNGKDRTPAHISDLELWQIHMPPFEAAVNAGSPSIMINSGSVNGIPGHINHYLLQNILRNKWGFKGVIVSDWEDVIRLHTRHKVAASPEEAVKMAIQAGLDMSMVPEDYSFAEHLLALVKKGEISESRIDQSVKRILKMKFDLGLVDKPYPNKALAEKLDRKKYAQDALRSAKRTMTLLKNTNQVLPLKQEQTILVAGPAANSLAALNGSWSYSWQGNNDALFDKRVLSLSDAMTQLATHNKVINIAKRPFEDSENTHIARLQKAAKQADIIILALGEHGYAESPGVINDLTLPADQIALAKAAYATGKPVVLVLLEGRPRVISEIVPQASAILMAYRPGTQGGKAIAETLLGTNNPSGVLPFSYPRNTGDIIAYDHYPLTTFAEVEPPNLTQNGYNPQWPFGHGLSYTSFKVSKLRVSKKRFRKGHTLTLSVEIKNTGKREGRKIVDLFISDHYASQSPAVKRLREFKTVNLKAGKKTTVKFTINEIDFSFINEKGETIIEPGMFTIDVAGQKIDVEYTR